MKVLHIATDEKFINSISWQFDRLNNTENKFIILLESANTEVKYVNLKADFHPILKNKKGLQLCVEEIKNHDVTIFHGLNYFQSQIVLKSSNKSKLVWFFWGGEFYDNPKASVGNFIGEQTKKIFAKTTSKQKLKSLIRPVFYYLNNKTKIPEQHVLDAAQKIKYFGILYKEEMQYFKDLGYLSQDVSLFKMTYYPLEFIFKGIENIKVNGQNILLGNSASLTNNHLEAFNALKGFNLDSRKLIIPLSYGDRAYGSEVAEIGRSIFGDSIQPVFNFMPLDEFNTLASSCNVVIMNHYRQQAVGNIIAMLWMGAKVYLNESNTFYHYLKRLGIFIYSIDKDLNADNSKALVGPEEAQISQNRQILINELGFDIVKKNMEDQFKSILMDVN